MTDINSVNLLHGHRKAKKNKGPTMKKKTVLKGLSIPYKIEFSNALVSFLMRIAECRPFFDQSLSQPRKLSLLRNAKLKMITYSNQIEGNPLKESHVQLVLRKKQKQKEKFEREVQNYSDALAFAEKLAMNPRPISINDFCDIQRMVTSGLLHEKQVGKIRTIPVSIVNASTGEKVASCPEPHALKEAMEDLWTWLDETNELNPYTRAFAFHFIAVSIHPFADGNGRTVRLMQHLLLLRAGQEIVKYVPSETAIMKYRDEYYSVIRQAKKLMCLTPVLEFLARCFCEAAEDVTKEAKNLMKKHSLTLAQRHHKILQLLKRKKQIKAEDVFNLFPHTPKRTLERDLASLHKAKKMKAKGKKKGRVYSYMLKMLW